MSDRVRVAFVMHAMQVAGAEVLVSEIIRRGSERVAPVVLCLDEIGALGEQLQGQGVPVEVLGREPGIDLGLARRLGRSLQGHRSQVVHAHQYTPFFYAATSRLVTKQTSGLVFTEHGRHFPDVVSRQRRFLNQVLLARLATEINACSEFSGRALSVVDGFPAKRVQVIENGIELNRYGAPADSAALRRRLGWPVDSQIVTCVARFHPVKDHATLIQAFHMLRRSMPAARLMLVGEGPQRGQIEDLIRSLDLEGSVSLLGVRGDVPALLAASDVFSMTSLSEAASLTVLEAMASELPVVVTEVGGNPEMVRQEIDGLLVPRQDPEATARAIGRLLSSPVEARKMGRSARQRVEERYDLERTVERHLAVYDRLVGAASA